MSHFSLAVEIVIPSSINEIGEDFVYGCSKLERLCYNGDQEHWDIVLKPDVDTDVYYYSETQPEENGNYWHFIDSDIAIW